MSNPVLQLKTYLSPSLTPQGLQRPMNEKIIGKPGLSNSGNVDMRKNPTRHISDGSFIHGRKVDSPKIFLGHQTCDDRPKTSAQQTRKVKTKDIKDTKKKAVTRKHTATLNASQVVAPQSTLLGKAMLNLGGL
jgi:hypothetical protein